VARIKVSRLNLYLWWSFLGVCRRIPSWARERAVFRLARTVKQAISVYIVDAAGHSPVVKQAARSQIGFSDRLLEPVFAWKE
jgi:hypothetical protein